MLWQSLIATVNEQAKALQRAAFSPIVREAGDLANAVFDRRGRMVAQAVTGTPGHINSLARGASAILDEYPTDSLVEGDVLITNDPYKTAGQLLDVTVLYPVFRERPGDRLLRLDDPPHRRRRLRHRRRRPRRVRGRALDPDLQADGRRRAQRRRVEVHPLQRPPARPHGRRPARPDGDRRGRRAAPARAVRRATASTTSRTLADEIIEPLRGGDPGERSASCRPARTAAQRRARPRRRQHDRHRLRDHRRPRCRRDPRRLRRLVGRQPVRHQRRQELHPRLHDVHGARRCSTRSCRTTTAAWRRSRSRRRWASIVNAVSPQPCTARHVVGMFLPNALLKALAQIKPEQSMAEGSGAVWTMQVSGNHDDGRPFITAMFTYAGGVGARATKPGLSALLVPDRRRRRADRGRRGVGADPLPAQGAARRAAAATGAQIGGLGQTIEFTVDTDAAVAAQRRHVAAAATRRRASSAARPGAVGSFTVNGEPVTHAGPRDAAARRRRAPRPARRRRLRRRRVADAAGGRLTWRTLSTWSAGARSRRVAARGRARRRAVPRVRGARRRRRQTWTYGEFDVVVAAWRRGLLQHGVGPGSRCTSRSPTRRRSSLVAGDDRLGAWIVPSDPMGATPELAGHIERTAPVVGFCAVDAGRRLPRRAAGGRCRSSRSTRPTATSAPFGARAARPTGRRPEPRDRAAVMFTSGTTGGRRASRSPRPTTRSPARRWPRPPACEAQHRQLVVLPLFHANAQYYSFASAISVGASRGADAHVLGERVPRAGRPPRGHARQPVRRADPHDPQPRRRAREPGVAAASTAGTPMNITDDQHETLAALLGCRPRQLYGMTETHPGRAHRRARHDPMPSSMGYVTPGCDVRGAAARRHADRAGRGRRDRRRRRAGHHAVRRLPRRPGRRPRRRSATAGSSPATGARRDDDGRFFFDGRRSRRAEGRRRERVDRRGRAGARRAPGGARSGGGRPARRRPRRGAGRRSSSPPTRRTRRRSTSCTSGARNG